MGKFKKRRFYRVNHYIQAREVRVIDETGKQIGVMPLEKAIFQAQNKGLDLVEVASKTVPPVAKIVDFKKFKYLEKKKRTAKKAKKSELKEIRLNPFIAENDLKNRLERAKRFLGEKNQVKVVIFFRGRQIAKKDFGYRLVDKITEKLKDCAQVIEEPKFLGRRLIMTLTPNEKKSVKAKTENKKVSQKKVSTDQNR